jgi:Fic family protein
MTSLFQSIGLEWDRKLFPLSVRASAPDRAVKRFLKSMPQYVWDAAQLEGNPYTFPEVQTLLEGITVGGHKVSDTQQILGLRDGIVMLCDAVRAGTFSTSRDMACKLNGVIARDEALEWGHFRGEGKELTNVRVNLGSQSYLPKPTIAGGEALIETYMQGVQALETHAPDPVERAFALKLFMAREQFFSDGNKRTARAMMNGVLMHTGIDGCSIPARKRLAYNEAMTRFYPTGDATEMMMFLADCLREIVDA